MSECPRCGADHEAEARIREMLDALDAQKPKHEYKLIRTDGDAADALRAEGAATERARILAIIDCAIGRVPISAYRDPENHLRRVRAEVERGAETGEK